MVGTLRRKPHVWLAYVSYPVTTAVYLERALRKVCRVTTIGPRLADEMIGVWSLENMKLPVLPHDIQTDATPDMLQIWEQTAPQDRPDIYLWVESVSGHFPRNIKCLPCLKACCLIDMHINLELHRDFAGQFDHAFVVHRQYVDKVGQLGPLSHWLPVACDPEIHRGDTGEKRYEIGFVGSVAAGTRRDILLRQLDAALPLHVERCFWDDMAAVFAASKMVFNSSFNHDLNMRFFEVLSVGSLLLSDMAGDSGQAELFVAGEDYARYQDETLCDVARFYLKHGHLAEQIGQWGRLLVHGAHTYDHRVQDLLAVVTGRKADTWSAAELRSQSVRAALQVLRGQGS
ncbi:MAG: glycosyltransferase [Trichlorobacter sp.]|uniref:glycosyltransferase family protein n=1 Tax=Trichlorobacter sp. TaxID=2911007 RepID=UPI00255DF380|nr:glycosyltransferase [Trichlorobacter sp.]MDK9717035.1 glycosyltransferase [Trichlorobacter sp.]